MWNLNILYFLQCEACSEKPRPRRTVCQSVMRYTLPPTIYPCRNHTPLVKGDWSSGSRIFSTHRKIDDLSICPPNIILYLFRLLVIPYTWYKPLSVQPFQPITFNYKWVILFVIIFVISHLIRRPLFYLLN